ncbi:phosphoribosylformylglycinamidine cyclo-ligase [soil metagenome]
MKEEFTYREAGVDTKHAAALVGDIGKLVARTQGRRSLFQAFGLFAASYDLSGYDEPVIVTGCDGVGTKIEPLLKHDMLEAAGKDLVAMSVNDILTTGGEPILFLDYIGIPKIDDAQITRLISGMVDYLEACNCILAGGETAEMPGIVPEGVIELSGFCIGAAEKRDLIDPSIVAPGDALIGFPSDGFHANGWSLVRRILAANPGLLDEAELRALLAPTRLYHEEVAALREAGVTIKAMAHITGGGLPENLERLLGPNGADLRIGHWERGPIPKVLAFVETQEAVNTFNMGYGWVVIVPAGEADRTCVRGGEMIGTVVPDKGVRVMVG